MNKSDNQRLVMIFMLLLILLATLLSAMLSKQARDEIRRELQHHSDLLQQFNSRIQALEDK